jgi:TonB family protein
VAVLTYQGSGSISITGNFSFDEAERWYTAELRRNDGVMRSPSGVSSSVSMSLGAGGSSGGESSGAVRVGRGVGSPVKVVDVPPVLPEPAVRANVRGIVILEVIVDVDGTVMDARVLRSVPLLDAAALEAVRQWRYQPTTLGGKPVRVIMTVPVGF